jgi:hypothetical protein
MLPPQEVDKGKSLRDGARLPVAAGIVTRGMLGGCRHAMHNVEPLIERRDLRHSVVQHHGGMDRVADARAGGEQISCAVGVG